MISLIRCRAERTKFVSLSLKRNLERPRHSTARATPATPGSCRPRTRCPPARTVPLNFAGARAKASSRNSTYTTAPRAELQLPLRAPPPAARNKQCLRQHRHDRTVPVAVLTPQIVALAPPPHCWSSRQMTVDSKSRWRPARGVAIKVSAMSTAAAKTPRRAPA